MSARRLLCIVAEVQRSAGTLQLAHASTGGFILSAAARVHRVDVSPVPRDQESVLPARRLGRSAESEQLHQSAVSSWNSFL